MKVLNEIVHMEHNGTSKHNKCKLIKKINKIQSVFITKIKKMPRVEILPNRIYSCLKPFQSLKLPKAWFTMVILIGYNILSPTNV